MYHQELGIYPCPVPDFFSLESPFIPRTPCPEPWDWPVHTDWEQDLLLGKHVGKVVSVTIRAMNNPLEIPGATHQEK